MDTLVLIGASTGGPGHLKKILSSLTKESKAIFIIVQHMNASVMESFSSQLREHSMLSVSLVTGREELLASTVYVCAHTLELSIEHGRIYLNQSTKEAIYTPSINILFHSALELLPKKKVIPILLTGIGDDGAEGTYQLHQKGAYCIAESEESAIVYGMPKKAYEINKEIKVMHLNKIIKFLQNV
ncbi:chemotaxis protein CheB [Sulfurimonas sp. SAG-AH-194-C21]|nr:CheB methylesterase domain-containing protein [Sulfurimonas sp. SAG-AH-194-C21]MDF1882444.1 chemotaxis protein CheB [Sulfurimonas sp. SAG-AH-194-C21]